MDKIDITNISIKNVKNIVPIEIYDKVNNTELLNFCKKYYFEKKEEINILNPRSKNGTKLYINDTDYFYIYLPSINNKFIKIDFDNDININYILNIYITIIKYFIHNNIKFKWTKLSDIILYNMKIVTYNYNLKYINIYYFKNLYNYLMKNHYNYKEKNINTINQLKNISYFKYPPYTENQDYIIYQNLYNNLYLYNIYSKEQYPIDINNRYNKINDNIILNINNRHINMFLSQDKNDIKTMSHSFIVPEVFVNNQVNMPIQKEYYFIKFSNTNDTDIILNYIDVFNSNIINFKYTLSTTGGIKINIKYNSVFEEMHKKILCNFINYYYLDEQFKQKIITDSRIKF